MLVRSAHSANIKERRDCSTALFDAAGEMVMQAEHIPVHLGAMPDAVAAVLGEDHARGRAPGSSTTPIAAAPTCPTSRSSRRSSTDGELLGFAACRAHHADVGGRVPGSMPADSRTLDEEGVVIAPRVLDDAAIDELTRRCASRASAAPTCAPSSPPTGSACGACGELATRLGPRALRDIDRGRARLRRAAHARLPRGAGGRHAPRAGRARGASTGTSLELRCDRRRRPADARLHRHRPRSTPGTSTARSR